MSESIHLLGTSTGPVGVLSRPSDDEHQRSTGVIFLNSGLLHRVGPFCLYVSLARKLAELGYASLRIDQSGKGDSERRAQADFDESVRRDCMDAIGFLKQRTGAEQFVVIGLCSGADDSLFLANELPDIRGAGLLEAFAFRTARYYRRHYLPRLLRGELYWIALRRGISHLADRLSGRADAAAATKEDFGVVREFSGNEAIRMRYRTALENETKLLCVFTDGSRSYYNYEGQLNEALGIPGSDRLIQEHYLPGAKHTYPIVADRQAVMTLVADWLIREFPETTNQA